MDGPKVTLEQIESRIVEEKFIVEGTTTLCLLALVNGFTVVGKSGCVDPANFDKAIGERIARDNAVREIWPLEGYALANRLLFERDLAAAERIDGLAAEVDGMRVATKVACIAVDDLEQAKVAIRTVLESGPAPALTRALALLTPETSPMVVFGGGGADDGDPFNDFLDRSIEEIVPDLEGLSLIELGRVLAKECGGKTRKGLVKAIGAELGSRASDAS